MINSNVQTERWIKNQHEQMKTVEFELMKMTYLLSLYPKINKEISLNKRVLITYLEKNYSTTFAQQVYRRLYYLHHPTHSCMHRQGRALNRRTP